MDLGALLVRSLWAGLFASGFGILFTAPLRYAVPAFLSGFAGSLARDALMGWGLTQNWSTVVATVVVVLVAVAVVRRHSAPPAVLISAVLPLGAASAMFNAILGMMQISSLKGDALSAAAIALSANVSKAFTVTLAIALGLAIGMAMVRLIKGEEVWERV